MKTAKSKDSLPLLKCCDDLNLDLALAFLLIHLLGHPLTRTDPNLCRVFIFCYPSTAHFLHTSLPISAASEH